MSNMKAVELLHTRVVYSTTTFAELVLWRVPNAVRGSLHAYKYRLAYVAEGICVIRYDNEAGKGDHRHYAGHESRYKFTTPDRLMKDFENDIARWNRENRNT
jgi:hypothetical protein